MATYLSNSGSRAINHLSFLLGKIYSKKIKINKENFSKEPEEFMKKKKCIQRELKNRNVSQVLKYVKPTANILQLGVYAKKDNRANKTQSSRSVYMAAEL